MTKEQIPSWPVVRFAEDPLLKELFINEDRASVNRSLQEADRIKLAARFEMKRTAALQYPTTLPAECKAEVSKRHKLGCKTHGWINRVKGTE